MAGFEGRTVLVTGASRGIGLATAKEFLSQGARVAIVARNAERLAEAAAALGDDCCAVAADLVGAALWLTRRVLPGMQARGYGRILLVASELGLIGGPSYASYCTSKFALVGLAEVLWHELAGSGVRACAVCPGDVRTDQLEQEHVWGPTGGVPPEKAMSPERVARAIVGAADSRNAVTIVDKPHLRTVFNLWGGPRRLRLTPVHNAYRELLRTRGSLDRQPRSASSAE